jgi:hypothetical protein
MSAKKTTSKSTRKKNTKSKAWMKVVQKVHVLSKKNNLGFSWTDSLRFASQKVYPEFKGKKNNEIKLTEITNSFNIAIGKTVVAPTPQTPPAVPPKPKKVCYSPLLIPLDDLQEREWFFVGDDSIWVNFPSNLQMRFAFEGIIDTGIIMKSEMPDMVSIREQMRVMYGKSSPVPVVIFKILVAPDSQDDGKPCSYYVLVTIEDSNYDAETQNEIFSKVNEEGLSDEEKRLRQEKIDQANADKLAKSTKKQAKARQRPSQVEPTPKDDETPSKDDTSDADTLAKKEKDKMDLDRALIEKDRINALTEALNIIRQDFKDKIITKRRYVELQKKIIDKFEKGGKI